MKNKGTNRLQIVAGVSLVIVAALCCAAGLYSVGAGGGFAISIAPADTEAEVTTTPQSDVKVYFVNTDWANMVLVEGEYADNMVFLSEFMYDNGEYEDIYSSAKRNHIWFDQAGEVIPWEKLEKPKELWYPVITIRDPEIVEHDIENGRMYPLKEGETVLQLSYGGATTQVPITVTKVTPAVDEKSVEAVQLGQTDSFSIERVFYDYDNVTVLDGTEDRNWFALDLDVKYAGRRYFDCLGSNNDVAKVYVEDESIALIEGGNIWSYQLYTRKGGKTNIIVEIYGQKFTFPLEVKDNKLEGLRLELLEFGQDDTVKVEHVGKHAQLEIAVGDSRASRLYAQMSDGSEEQINYCDFVAYRSSDREAVEMTMYGDIWAYKAGEYTVTIKVLDQKITLDVTVK